MVPPHLVTKWEREIAETIPDATITILKTYHDVVRLDVTAQARRPRVVRGVADECEDDAQVGAVVRAQEEAGRRAALPALW